jgi:hypothetical protein
MNKKKMNECMNEKLFDPMHTQTIPSKLPPFDLALYSSKLLAPAPPAPFLPISFSIHPNCPLWNSLNYSSKLFHSLFPFAPLCSSKLLHSLFGFAPLLFIQTGPVTPRSLFIQKNALDCAFCSSKQQLPAPPPFSLSLSLARSLGSDRRSCSECVHASPLSEYTAV